MAVRLFLLPNNKLHSIRQLLDLLAELPPFGQSVIFTLAVDRLQAAVISSKSRCQLEAAGVGI